MPLTSLIDYVQAIDTSETDGSGKTGLAFGDITAKYLIQGGVLTSLTTETITTLGTYQAPTSNAHIRIKELANTDPTKGIYEVHFHNDQVAAAGKRLRVFFSATGARFIPLALDLLLNDVKSLNESTQSLTDLKDLVDTGYDPATHKIQGVVTTDTATNTGTLAGAATVVLTDASLTAAKFAVDSIAANAIAADAVTKIQNGLASQTSVDDVPTSAEMALLLAAADDAMLSAIDAVQTDTDNIQTRLPAALVGGKMDSVASVTLDADDIDDIAAAVIDGLGNQAINIVSPFAVGGALTVFTGDSYLAANNTSLRFNLVGRSDLIGLIPHLIGKCGTSFDLTASAVVSGTETMTFSDLTGAVTSLLTPGAGSAPERGEYQIRFYDGSGNKVTETSGIMYVRRGLS